MEMIGKIGMNTAGSNKIGLETDRMERIVSGELACDMLVVGCCGVDPHQSLRHPLSGLLMNNAVPELGFPNRITFGIKIVHDRSEERRVGKEYECRWGGW